MQKPSMKQLTAWLALLATVLVLFFSVFYIGRHISHDCTGDECPICACLEQCVTVLKTVGTAFVIVCATIILSNLWQEKEQDMFFKNACYSLISQKVRMNN